jgi:hypothetical protein
VERPPFPFLENFPPFPYEWEGMFSTGVGKMENLQTLYDRNYAEWAKKNAELLREGKFSELDIDHLVEANEISCHGRVKPRQVEIPPRPPGTAAP